jgi:hypothetical protein
MFTRKFWMDLGERVIASAAGGALAVITAGVSSPEKIAIGAGVGALVSLLKGIVATQVGKSDSASLVE